MNKQKRNLILLAAAAAVLVVAIVLFAVLNTTGRGGERATLQQLYEGLYTTEGGGINTIIDTILPAMQQEYYNSITTGGTNFSQLAMWQNEAHSMVGGNVQVSVKVLQVQEDSATTLNTMRATYGSAIEAYHPVAFQLTLTGDSGSQDLVGVLPTLMIADEHIPAVLQLLSAPVPDIAQDMVRLELAGAVSALTGLGTDRISICAGAP